MIRTSRIMKSFMKGRLLCVAACLVLAGALLFPGTSFGAWVTDTFNPAVTCNPDRPDPLDCVHAVAVQTDGSVIVGGYVSTPGAWLARFTSTGGSDGTFNNNVNNNLDLDGPVDHIVIQGDGKIVIGGRFSHVNGSTRYGIARISSTGTLDTSFNPLLDNLDPTSLHEATVTELTLQADGNLLVGGTFKNAGGGVSPANLHPFFVRLLTAGTGTGAVDTTFTPDVSSTVHSIIALDTGTFASNKKILAAGNFYKMNCTYCTNLVPLLDPNILPGDPKYPSYYYCMDSDGTTHVNYGQCMSSGADLVNYVVLLNMNNGSRDTNFQSQRIIGEDLVYEIARQSDGKVVVGGNINDPTKNQPYLQRMNSGGDIDSGYNPNANGPVRALAMQASDNLITGGTFTVIGGATRNYISRLSSAVALDAAFDPNANGPVYTIYSSSTSTAVIIGGGFTSVGGVGRSYLARLYNDNKTTTSTSISAPLASYGTGTVTVIVSAATGTPTSGNVTLVASGPTTTWTKSLSGSNIALFPVSAVIPGDHALTASYAGTPTYAASSAAGTLTVTKALLTVTANSVSRQYLNNNPPFTASYSGFVNTDTVSVLTGTPLLTTAATYSSPIGTYPISAAPGSLTAANYSFGFIDGVLTITPTVTTTSVVSSSPTSSFGTSVTFIATVVGNGATGTVTFNDGGAALGSPVALSGGTAAYSTSLLSAGTHTITAVYSGDASFGTSTSSPITQTVNKASTTTNVVSSSLTAIYGSPVTFTATIDKAGATGTVTFMDGIATLGTGTLSGGSPNTATYTTSALGVAGNPHSITAVYSGDASFGTSTSSAITQTINQSTLTPVISSSGSPSAYGIPVTFTATVSGATGTVTFKDGAAVLGTGTLISGVASYTTSTLSVSGNPHSITAVYGGDVNFAASTSNVFAQNITQAASTTSIASNLNPSVYGTPVTFTATISGAAATGTVTFRDGGATLGTGIISGGMATYTTSTLSVAGSPHSVTAVYGGDANYGGSSSLVATLQMVDKALPIITVVSSLPTSTHGNPVTFTATVEDLDATGTVTFKDGAATLGTGTLSGGSPNTATYTTSALGGGPHSITAAYSGDGNFLTSISGALTQTVDKASTTTSVTSSLPTSIYGNQVTFTATVTGVGATGTVTFMDGVTSFGTGTLSNGTAVYHTSALGAGGRSITAIYNGDGNFATSTSGALTQTVNKASTTTGISSNSNPSTYGGPVTFSANVSGASATGTVTFMDGVTSLGTGTLTAGSATFTTSALDFAGSPHYITAVYNGDANFIGSTSTPPLVQTVSKAVTTTSLASDYQTAAINTPVTFTATVSGAGATGTVQFYDNGNILDTKTLSSGLAVYTTSVLALGNHQITAIFSGDSNFNGSSTAAPTTLVIAPHTSSTTLSSVQNPSDFGTLATFNANVTSASGVDLTGTVTFKDGATTLGTITLSNGFAQYSTSTLGGGAHSITAMYSGDANYGTSTSSPLDQTVNKANQTITFGALAPKMYGNADFAPGATASSNLPVTYASSNPLVATVSGSNIHIVGAGNATITASQVGDNNYNATTSEQLLTVNKANQAITFAPLAPKTYGNADFAPGATASSNLPVTYASSNPLVATVSGSNIHIVGAGNATITASQVGDNNYNATTSEQLLTVNKANQTITFSALLPKIPGDLDFSPGATASSNRPVTYTSSNPAVATVSGSNIHIVGNTGTTTITASEGGDDNCNAAAPVQQSLTVVMADGKFDDNQNAVGAADALKSLRIAVGLDVPSQDDLAHGDVAPLAYGQRHPDGKIDLTDVVAILRKAANLPSW